MRKALSRDKEKKSMIPLKRPVRPDELDWPWARWITMETSCYGYYWGQPFLFWFQFCTFWSENLDFPQMMHPLPAQISKTWKYGERREGGGVVTDSVQFFAEVIKMSDMILHSDHKISLVRMKWVLKAWLLWLLWLWWVSWWIAVSD